MAYSARPTSSNALTQLVNLTAHGFVEGQILILDSSSVWVNAQANSLANCAGTWIVYVVIDANSFYICQEGYLTGLPGPNYASPSPFTIGVQYYLSPTTGGTLTTTKPASVGQVELPCFIADSASSGYWYGGSGQLVESSVLFGWSIASVNTNMAINQGYFTSSGGTVQLLLPTTAAIGDVVRASNISGNFQIKQNAGQSINFGNDVTTPGTGGSISSTAVGDTLEIICYNANAGFQVLSSMGNLTFV
jgi:hypothetical protein